VNKTAFDIFSSFQSIEDTEARNLAKGISTAVDILVRAPWKKKS
jgi:hypothetical protein